ncbi:tetratricopeptide repeat protein [bacterium]|nr:tetratricopeptide repeat protein [bacterium]
MSDATQQVRSSATGISAIQGLGLLLLLTAAIYWPVANYEFVNFDDDVHVYDNPHVNTGVNTSNVVWAFGIHGPSQWHPLAWISHQLDCQLFGANRDPKSAGWHHLVNLCLHLGCIVLLFRFIEQLTGRSEPALLVAALFALHPLNVEAVAWISERRTVLCLFLMLAALLIWLQYAARPTISRYLIVALLLAMALMAKPMAVTFPCLLLMLDVWPLKRWSSGSAGKLIVEKLPLFGLSLVSSVLTVWCQQADGIISSMSALPLPLRLANAVMAYANYLRDTVYPWNLSVFYPHPALTGNFSLEASRLPILISTVLLLTVTYLCWRWRTRSPWLLFGWCWFLGTLVPMIGLVQSGYQQRADRYTYLPNIGLYLAVAASLPWATGSPRVRQRLSYGCIGVLVILTVLTSLQVSVWHSSQTLFEQALIANPRNSWAHLNAGQAAQERNELDLAEQHFQMALAIQPDYGLAHYNLGVIAYDRGQYDQALAHFQEAVRLDARNADAWVRLGAMLGQSGNVEEAERCFVTALQMEPENIHARSNLEVLKSLNGR